MICFFCPGVAHPSTGCQCSERVIACRDCVVTFWAWFREQQNKRVPRKKPDKNHPLRVHADFYAAAGKR